jgi:hypothetical protein
MHDFEQLKADVLKGAASLDRGEGIPASEVYAKVRALIDKIEATKRCNAARVV